MPERGPPESVRCMCGRWLYRPQNCLLGAFLGASLWSYLVKRFAGPNCNWRLWTPQPPLLLTTGE